MHPPAAPPAASAARPLSDCGGSLVTEQSRSFPVHPLPPRPLPAAPVHSAAAPAARPLNSVCGGTLDTEHGRSMLPPAPRSTSSHRKKGRKAGASASGRRAPSGSGSGSGSGSSLAPASASVQPSRVSAASVNTQHAPASSSATASTQPSSSASAQLRYSVDTERHNFWRHADGKPVERVEPDQRKDPGDEFYFDAAVRWPDNGLLLAAFTNYLPLPPPPDNHTVYVCRDGLWGQHEYTMQPQFYDHLSPHLVCLPVPLTAEDACHALFRQATEHDWVPHHEKDKRDLFIMEDQRYLEFSELVTDLEARLKMAEECWERTSNARDWDREGKSRVRQMFAASQRPSWARATMLEAYDTLKVHGVSSGALFKLYWTAMQRAAREIVAFVDFCALFLPSKSVRDRLEPSVLRGFGRRGTILNGADQRYYDLFVDKEVPVYTIVWQGTYFLREKDSRLRPPSTPQRCLNEPDMKLSKAAGNANTTIRAYCTPPQGVAWKNVEKAARGVLPRGDLKSVPAAEGEPSKKKRKVEDENERPKGLSSKEHYEGFQSTNPGFIRHVHSLAKDRPPLLPRPFYEWALSRDRGLEHLTLLPEKEGYLASFIPPVHLFYGCTTRKRLHKYVLTTIRLLPVFLRRVHLARDDPKVLPLPAKKWREVLGGEYWEEQWPPEKVFNKDTFWEYGGDEIFGTKESRRIRLGGKFTPSILACGCEPTIEMLEDDPALIAGIVASLNQWELLHQFAALAQGALERQGVPTVMDGRRKYCLPDFYGAERTSKERTQKGERSVVHTIKQIVLHGEDVPANGWLKPWSAADTLDEPELRKWLLAMRTFFLRIADALKSFDELPGWMSRDALSLKYIESLQGAHLVELRRELMSRYFVACLMAGDWPVEFLENPEAPKMPEHVAKCRACTVVRLPWGYENELEDELDD